jgi:hypothetical protein
MESIRLNKKEFLLNTDKDKLVKYTEIFNNSLLSKRVKIFLEYANNA